MLNVRQFHDFRIVMHDQKVGMIWKPTDGEGDHNHDHHLNDLTKRVSRQKGFSKKVSLGHKMSGLVSQNPINLKEEITIVTLGD
jgi:hypothetical protein